MLFLVILSILTLNFGAEALKILVFYPTPSYSHQRAILALTERLVRDGHELFVLNTDPVPGLEKHENYTHVDFSFSYKYFSDEKKEGTVHLQEQLTKWDLPVMVAPFVDIARKQFISKQFLQFQNRIETEQIKFDVAIMETFFLQFTCPMTRILAGNTPIISMSTVVTDLYAEDALGSITHSSFVPFPFNDYTNKMSLWQKIENWYSSKHLINYFKHKSTVAAKSFFDENYGSGNQSLVDMCFNDVSLSLIASNFLYFYPRLLGPNVVEVGPLHLKPPKKLPKNLQDWLDGAEKGVIYFSLGSNMKSKSLPLDVRANFLKFFRELPSGYRILWKWELEGKVPGQSDNILAQKWLPQESVLAHPKVRVFITQGGLQSFQEAVHFGVPLVGIPWFGDQECDVAKMVDAGIGVRLRPTELQSFEKIKSAIETVLYNERYMRNMKRHSAISHDFTSRGMDTAVFWVEHVAKFGGAHLVPSTADATLLQFFCWDIISVILGLSLTALYLIYVVCKRLFSTVLPTIRIKIKRA